MSPEEDSQVLRLIAALYSQLNAAGDEILALRAQRDELQAELNRRNARRRSKTTT